MELRGAILIVGSLLWDTDQGNNLGIRKKWRNTRLNMSDKIHIKAPIRYGRLSGREPNKHYTIVFSKECEEQEKFGTAFVVPFKAQSVRSFKAIENQARSLSKVEGNSDNYLCKGDANKWCTIGAILNPKLDKKLKLKFLNHWYGLLDKEGGLKDFNEYKIGSEESILSKSGEIKINWPMALTENDQEKINNIDIILATCTKPNNKVYPSIEDLQKNIQTDTRRYFLNNIERGITTFQDRKILSCLY